MLSHLLRPLELKKKDFFKILLGCAIMAFGVVNVHEPAQITEGGEGRQMVQIGKDRAHKVKDPIES